MSSSRMSACLCNRSELLEVEADDGVGEDPSVFLYVAFGHVDDEVFVVDDGEAYHLLASSRTSSRSMLVLAWRPEMTLTSRRHFSRISSPSLIDHLRMKCLYTWGWLNRRTTAQTAPVGARMHYASRREQCLDHKEHCPSRKEHCPVSMSYRWARRFSRSCSSCPMSIEVIEISSSDEDGEEEFEEKVKTKLMANRSTGGASSGAKQYSIWGSKRVEEPWEWDEYEEEEYEYEEDEVEDDDDDDCFILPNNPSLGDQLDLSRRLTLDSPPLSDDVAIIAERGKCYCYVCDEPAPCDRWEKHCEASDKHILWNDMRRDHRAARRKVKPES
ncbi:hypothetical protein ZIOFF_014265 [Zingiber officinale]|uniref:Uncharacterized protein n=1 Tax=Zingiber officinale TaxID=94328 RepID=A0A8J5LLI1_ZINOF|nr:hypothetical protein ZIOFF_014265 [Zingiber officinale]